MVALTSNKLKRTIAEWHKVGYHPEPLFVMFLQIYGNIDIDRCVVRN